MSLTNTPQAKLLFEKMRHTQARQEVASTNMAKSGVAGAKSQEVESFKKSMKRPKNTSTLKTTNKGHMVGSTQKNHYKISKSKEQGDPSLTGNSISPEEQLLALNEAGSDYYRLEQVFKNEKKRAQTTASLGNGK